MKNKLSILTIALVIILAFAGCSSNISTQETGELKELTIGVMPDIDTVPLLLADELGYFEEEGLIVNIEQFKSAMDRDAALQTNNLDGAISDMLGIIFLNDAGFNVKITSATNGSFKMLASPNSNINSVKDINNNTIGISSNTIIDYLTDTILTSNDMTTDIIDRQIIPKIPARLEMLNNSKIDMATLPEPLASIAISAGAKVISSSNELGINSAYMIFTEDSLNNKSDEIKAMYRAYNKAVKYYQETEVSEFVDIVVEKGSFPPLIGKTLESHDFDLAFLPTEADVTSVLTWLKAKELTTSNYTLSDLLDGSFIEN